MIFFKPEDDDYLIFIIHDGEATRLFCLEETDLSKEADTITDIIGSQLKKKNHKDGIWIFRVKTENFNVKSEYLGNSSEQQSYILYYDDEDLDVFFC